jgi:hypothetical protein
MSDPADALLLDLLEWVAVRERPYADLMDAWRTSCPRLTIWEEANDRGLLLRRAGAGGGDVAITPAGRVYLERHRRHSDPAGEDSEAAAIKEPRAPIAGLLRRPSRASQ